MAEKDEKSGFAEEATPFENDDLHALGIDPNGEKWKAFLREAEEAEQDYLRTGLHLTGDEVLEWLRARARGEDPPMPECHT